VLDRLANTSLYYLLTMAAVLFVLVVVCPRLLLKAKRASKSQTKTPRWIGAALAIWFLITLLSFVELGFAVLYDSTDSFSMTNVSRRWFLIHSKPDERVMKFADGTGFVYRDDADFPKTIGKNEKQIVFLGDSFTYGHGVANVANRFSNLIRRDLNDRDQTFHVTNLAKPGTDLNWAASQLTQLFEAGHQIDSAVYVMCLNDIEAFQDPQMKRSIQLSHFEPPTFLFRDTYFLNWIYFRFQQVSRREVRDYYSFVKQYYAGKPWTRFEAKLRAVKMLCDENDTELHVVVFPFLHSLGPDYAFKNIHAQITAVCAANGIPAIDLLETLTQNAKAGLTVNPFDAHPNERAHSLAAKAILQQLR
jgi:lysophospholipase L1-like esterase